MRKKRSTHTPKTSESTEIKQHTHTSKELNWSFDETVDPQTIFSKVKLVGKGGFGIVSKIIHTPSGKILAGKLINPALVNEKFKTEIQNIIKLIKKINSPYIMHYYGCVLYEGSLMILMEYCDKGSFRDILDAKKQVLNEDQISIVMHDLLKGLQIIHKKCQIVHRDIKSANLLLASSGKICIADFGLSSRFETTGACDTKTIVGTPYWLAPEVISDTSYSYSSDIWSVGITAVELAEGSPPYVEFSPEKAMIEITLNGFPGYRFPNLHSPEFCDFVSHCVQSNPNDRWNISALLNHPFIKRAKRLNRINTLSDILSLQIPQKEINEEIAFDDTFSVNVSNENEEIINENTFLSDTFISLSSDDNSDASNRTNLSTAKSFTYEDHFNSDTFESAILHMSKTFNRNTYDSLGPINSPFSQISKSSENSTGSYGFISSASDTPMYAPSNSSNSDSFQFYQSADSTNDSFGQFESISNFDTSLSPSVMPPALDTIQLDNIPKVPDEIVSKVSRVMSSKIPFVPLRFGTNNTAETTELYKHKEATNVNINAPQKSKVSVPLMSVILILFVFLVFKEKGVAVIALYSVIAHLLLTYVMQKEKKK
ncbi:STE family protein kinase [Histomonas meleagridis]|uniref:STE family protein kinase n=1 Tax=Histomonas meleagridis TaxID=135588 RepID=UPI00355A5A65|nr:STE family protein kinase [Histomonas meleagridis]KAH0804113.1 STE family protein kinase [Histomonas meleagridis]